MCIFVETIQTMEYQTKVSINEIDYDATVVYNVKQGESAGCVCGECRCISPEIPDEIEIISVTTDDGDVVTDLVDICDIEKDIAENEI